MELNLEVLKTIGRKGTEISFTVERELAEGDFALLQDERGVQKPSAVSTLARLNERHRLIARLLADGKPNWEIAIVVGLTESRISILSKDPAMKNLVRHYQEEKDIAYVGVHEKLSHIQGMALDEIADRIEDDDGRAKLSLGQLMSVAEMGMNRTGFGPQAKSEVTVNVSIADRLQEARKRAAAARMIEATAVEVPMKVVA